MKSPRMHVLICCDTSALSSGASEVKGELETQLAKRGLREEVAIVETGALGFSAVDPAIVVYPGGIFYQALKPRDAEEIVEEHIVKGRPVNRLMFHEPGTDEAVPSFRQIPFFSRQNSRVLRNKGKIAPGKIEEYIAEDGYSALYKALHEMTEEQIVEEVKRAGLRGRGGGGFPTGLKWDLCRKAQGERKFILCNADEGDPGAFMDRSILESDPHAVLEGMIIGAKAIGASKGHIYCRAEYPLALERLRQAIAQCRERGLLGENILDSGFSFDIEISQGSGAFVCGEETALMRSIEGKRGEPRPRPPFPAHKGLWDMPSVLNNVETFANVPLIIREGADWFRSVGTEKSPGTKIFSVTGDVNNVGLIEVDIGVTLGEIVYDIGGGIPNGKEFKAAQIGGPSGGCIPKEHLNVPIDYESLTELGAIMGSGGLIVMDEDTCMVDMARFFLDFVQDESCGKCVPCRLGTKRMLEILTRICEGQGQEGDIEKLIALGEQIKDTALCGLGQTAPNPVLSTIRYFRDEYEAHIKYKRCPAGVCDALVRAPCQNACPASVDVPGFVSLISEKRYDEALRLHRERNPFASVCARVCFHPCESKCRRATLDAAVSVRALKRFMVEQEKSIQLPEIRLNEDNAKRKVAIVGAGPAGLTCAFFLARLGYRPKVFEAQDRPGGMLVQAIPAYRLPREALDREIRMIERMGVDIETGVALGKDITLEGLRDQGYEAVFLGIGMPEGLGLDLGEKIEGVVQAMDFLRTYNMTGKADVGEHVAVIGGGNAAIDAARTALRLGAKTVDILYRRTREEMPAYREEIEEAVREGAALHFLLSPVSLVAEKGKLAGIKCQTMKLGAFDNSGRRGPEPMDNGQCVVNADQVILAIGQSLDIGGLLGETDAALSPRKRLQVEWSNGQTSLDWLFAGGDSVTGASSVVEAIGAGERAAVGIDAFLTGEEHAFWREEREVDTFFDPAADPVEVGRAEQELLSVSKREGNFNEVERPLPAKVALMEAKRCLRCDFREED